MNHAVDARDSSSAAGSLAVVNNVMVVDDEREPSESLKAILQEAGLDVTIARDGGQVQGNWMMRKPDLVISKIILPGESGFEICNRVKKLDPNIPVILLTEIDLDSSRQLAKRVGVDGYAIKPIDESKFIEFLHSIAQRVWEHANDEHQKEEGKIKFRCKCGQKLRAKLSHAGKSMRCTSCNEMISIPHHDDNAIFVTLRSSNTESQGSTDTESQPFKFLTVKCQFCATSYRLFSGDEAKARTCPKCGKHQTGMLSIVGAPVARAALETSRRVLQIKSGKHRGKKMLLPNKEVVIGSADGCDIRNSSKGISGRHCSLKPAIQGLLVRDLGSEDGTRINGRAIDTETLLGPGDRLQIGTLRFELAGGGPVKAPEMSRKDRMALDRGVKIMRQTGSIASDAAKVIELHWNITRQAQADTDVMSDAETSA